MTGFPAALDVLANPSPTSPRTSPSHAGQHTDANDAIEAIEGYLLSVRGIANVLDPQWGVTGDGATNDTTAIRAFLAANAGKTCIFPRPPVEYLISDYLAPAAGTKCLGFMSKFYQTGSYKPVFDVGGSASGDDVEIDGFELRTDAQAWSATSFRSDGLGHYKSGVWIAGNRVTVRNIRATNFFNAVKPNNWDWATSTRHAYMTGLVVENIDVAGVWVGVMMTGQENFLIRGIRGSFVLPSGSPDPPHLIYTSDNTTPALFNRNGVIVGGSAFDGSLTTSAMPYSFKKLKGVAISNLTARSCHGLMSMDLCEDVEVVGLTDTDDLIDLDNGVIYFITSAMLRVHVSNVNIELAAPHRAVRLDGTDCSVRDLNVDRGGNAGETVTIAGVRNTLERVKVVADPATTQAVIYVSGGSDHVIRDIETHEGQYAVQIAAGVTGVTVDYDPRLITGTLEDRAMTTLEPGTTRFLPRPYSKSYSQNGGTVTIKPAAATHHWISITGGTALTIGNPATAESVKDMTLTVEIANDSGGAMGATTWGANFELLLAWVNPANTKRAVITFVHNGTKWREVSRVLGA